MNRCATTTTCPVPSALWHKDIPRTYGYHVQVMPKCVRRAVLPLLAAWASAAPKRASTPASESPATNDTSEIRKRFISVAPTLVLSVNHMERYIGISRHDLDLTSYSTVTTLRLRQRHARVVARKAMDDVVQVDRRRDSYALHRQVG